MSLTKAFYSVRQYVFNGIDNIDNYIDDYRAPSLVEAVTDGDNALQTAPDIWFPASGFLVQSAVNTYRPVHCKGVLTWNNTTNSVLTLQILGFKNFNNNCYIYFLLYCYFHWIYLHLISIVYDIYIGLFSLVKLPEQYFSFLIKYMKL